MSVITITTTKRQKQRQQQQQQVQLAQKQEQPQQQQQQQQVYEAPASLQQVVEMKPTKTKGGDYVTISKAKLVMILATCLLVTLFACCSKFRGDRHDEKQELDEQSKSVQREQMLVRKYVNEHLKSYSDNSKSSHGDDHNKRRQGYMFAKLILNAYDRPYQQVLDAINQQLKEIKDAGDNREALKALKPASRMLTEAYGKALESSQKHSVLIQEEIRRSQEMVRNLDGEMSLLDESLAQWHLEELADFEQRLVSTYLMYALEQEVD